LFTLLNAGLVVGRLLDIPFIGAFGLHSKGNFFYSANFAS